VGRNIYSQAPEYISHTIDNHQAVDELLVCSGGWGLKFEEGKGRDGSQDGIDAESDADCAEGIGDDGEGGVLGEGCGGHGVECLVLRESTRVQF